MDTVKKLIMDEIELINDELLELEKGSPAYKAVADRQVQLIARLTEIEKNEIEHKDKEAQMEDDKKDRVVRNVLTGLGIVLPVGVTVWGTCKSIKFEQTGTFTTIMGRGFINKLLPKK